MNRELRELFDSHNIVTKKITLKNGVKIIDSGDNTFVIKRRNRNLNDIFSYLRSRSFSYFPDVLYQTQHYDVYQYILDVDISYEERANDIIKLVSLLHSKTTFYKEIDDNNYKELYESIKNRIEYLYHYYDDFATVIEKEEFMSPSNYYFIRNISKIFSMLEYCRKNIEKWYDIISDKKRVRVVNIHNNLSLEHCLLSDKPYLISWGLSKRDLPIYDLIKFYKRYYNKLDFCDLIRSYEVNYPMLVEERILFFVLISIPEKLDFSGCEYEKCERVRGLYDYLLTSEKLISDYILEKN